MRRVGILGVAWLIGCGGAEPATQPPPGPAAGDPLAELRDYEEWAHLELDFGALAPAERVTGANPIELAALPTDGLFVAALAGADAVVVVDAAGTELQRLPAPRTPAALVVAPDGLVLVAGEASSRLQRYRAGEDGRLVAEGAIELDGVVGVSDLAIGGDGRLLVAETHQGRVLAVAGTAPGPQPAVELDRCHLPTRLAVAGAHLVVDCLADDEVRVYAPGRDGALARVATIVHDGPIWSVAAQRRGDEELLLALGGVEDHPLNRENGFGYIDSFVYLYALRLGDGALERRAAVNVSELGVVTPKWIALEVGQDGDVVVDAAGYGAGARVRLGWSSPADAALPVAEVTSLPPGTVTLLPVGGGAALAANPLLDAWVVAPAAGARARVVPVAGQAPRDPDALMGELLFFTTAMAPWNPAEGMASRFTCETCHAGGYGDGRVHWTGRGDVYATTKPLRGLANNRPHFSRALDRTMTDMVHAEFAVANKASGRNPWFALDAGVVAWLADVPGLPSRLWSPLALRRAFMRFLMTYTHAANPAAQRGAGARFTDAEARGAETFQRLCEGCHQARLVADVAGSRVSFARWEALVLSEAGPLVWGSDAYEKTGVTPYVHDAGARVPSLRRVYRKHPYFTNGGAGSLDEVLARVRIGADGELSHDGVVAGAVPLSAGEQADLAAFLALL